MEHSAALNGGRPGVLHGNRTYLLQDEDGQILEGHSISAGLDYPGVGPEHSYLRDIGRATYLSATDEEALSAFQLCAKLEGILPALEPSHALARVGDVAKELGLYSRQADDLWSYLGHFEPRELRDKHEDVVKADLALKSSPLEGVVIIELLVMKLCS